MNMLTGIVAVNAARELSQSALPDAPTVPGAGADSPQSRPPVAPWPAVCAGPPNGSNRGWRAD